MLLPSTQTGARVIVGEGLLVCEAVFEAEDEFVGEPVIEPLDEPVVDASLEDQVMYGSVVSAIAAERIDYCMLY